MKVVKRKKGYAIRKGLRLMTYAMIGGKTKFTDYFRVKYFRSEYKAQWTIDRLK